MATKIELFADYHTHTLYSHGKGSIEENIEVGMGKGLREIAITDHGMGSIGFGVRGTKAFQHAIDEIRIKQQEYPKIKVLAGAEANVLGEDGYIDVPKDILRQLDVVLVGLHPYIWTPTVKAAMYLNFAHPLRNILGRNFASKIANFNTKALIEAVCKNKVNIITHPGLRLNVNLDELAASCVKRNVALEINARRGDENRELIERTKKSGIQYAINSDAHKPKNVGDFQDGIVIAEKCELSAERIINAIH